MKGDPLPEKDHISRYCRPTALDPDGRPNGTAFMPRQKDGYLSINWLEYFDLPDRPAQIVQVRRTIGMDLAATGKFAVLNVGKVVKYVKENDPNKRVLDVLHEPEEKDLSHSGIYGYSFENDTVGDLIADVVRETCPAK